jgi:murein DD-endopeptidase MepM/ murein hydrolase activator NlpD
MSYNLPKLRYPARGPITSPFGWRVIFGKKHFHNGVDIGLPMRTPLRAPAFGTIISRWFDKVGGNCVIFEVIHNDLKIKLGYAHLDKLPDSSITRVKAGDIIAYSGNTGISTGPHVHYTMRINDQLVDPSLYHTFDAPYWPGTEEGDKRKQEPVKGATIELAQGKQIIIFS